MDDIVPETLDLKSVEGLGIIPKQIRERGIQAMIQHMLDLFQAPDLDPIFRCKLMLVGFQMAGKTSLVDALFPLVSYVHNVRENKVLFQGTKISAAPSQVYSLQGNVLSITNTAPLAPGAAPTETHLLKYGWKVANNDIKGYPYPGFRLLEPPEKPVVEVFCSKDDERDQWVHRLQHVLTRKRTHGIDITEVVADHERVRKFMASRNMKDAKLELSIWDFAGQHEFYNNHHHFLTTRSLFLVLWDLSENGLDGLHFWFKSLAYHLKGRGADKEYFSIIVVGTHFDLLSPEKQAKVEADIRETEVTRLAEETYGLSVSKYFEVCCVDSLTNINALQDSIFEVVLKMQFFDELVPKSYREIENYLNSLRKSCKEYPVVNIATICQEFSDEALVRRALSLLSDLGKCVDFGQNERLRDLVVLDPHFLCKTTLAALFRLDPEAIKSRKAGIIHHSDLRTFWVDLARREDFDDIAPVLIRLMEQFDVCFIMPEDSEKPFSEQRSVIPSLLPTRPNERATLQKISDTKVALKKCEESNQELHRTLEFFLMIMEKGISLSEPQHALKLQCEADIDKYLKTITKLMDDIGALETQLILARPWKQHWQDDPYTKHLAFFERVFRFTIVPQELVSRVIAKLHGFIQGNCVMQDCVLLQGGETQANIQVDLELNQFTVDLRSPRLADAEEFFAEISQTIDETIGDRTVSYIVGIKSPSDSTSIILLDALRAAEGPSFVDGTKTLPLQYLRQLAGLTERVFPPKREREPTPFFLN